MLDKLRRTSVIIDLEEMHSKPIPVDISYYYEPEEWDGCHKVWNAVVEVDDVKLFGNSIYGMIDDYQYSVIEDAILELHKESFNGH